MIVENSSLNCPTRDFIYLLWGFHTIMSFVGIIGYIMDGSGLRDVFDLMYAINTTPHLLSGKAFSRAIRAHIIVKSALFAVINNNILSFTNEHEVGDDKSIIKNNSPINLKNFFRMSIQIRYPKKR
jgi:hypothetical protein